MEKAKFKVLLFLLVILSSCTSPIKEDVENKTAEKDVLKTKPQLEKRVPKGPNPYADKYWDPVCRCWKPGKKPKLIKLSKPPINNLYFIYKRSPIPDLRVYSPFPKPNKKNTFIYYYYIDSQNKYIFHSVYVVDIIKRYAPKFPINSIQRIQITSNWGNFLNVNRYGKGTYIVPTQKQISGWNYMHDYLFVKIYMNKPYKTLPRFGVYWHYKIEK